jgi:hypothetical protein
MSRKLYNRRASSPKSGEKKNSEGLSPDRLEKFRILWSLVKAVIKAITNIVLALLDKSYLESRLAHCLPVAGRIFDWYWVPHGADVDICRSMKHQLLTVHNQGGPKFQERFLR